MKKKYKRLSWIEASKKGKVIVWSADSLNWDYLPDNFIDLVNHEMKGYKVKYGYKKNY